MAEIVIHPAAEKQACDEMECLRVNSCNILQDSERMLVKHYELV